jgi:asparagine synthase (glutamine-hydrolysing)
VADLGPADLLPGGTPIERTTALCLGNYTRNQLLRDIDAGSMAHALEVRVPLLDHELADFALSLPDTAKLRPHAAPAGSYEASGLKRILVDVGRRYLPPGFSSRTKRGFSLPFDNWLRGPLSPLLADCLAPDTVARRGLFDVPNVERTAADFSDGRIGWTRPWLLMMTELWCRECLD